MRWLLVFVVAMGWSSAHAKPSSPPPVPGCEDGVRGGALATDIAAELGVSYAIGGTTLRVCVYRALYPYTSRRGHRLYACYSAVMGSSSNVTRVCGEERSFFEYRGYRIEVWMRTPRYTEESDVWLRVEKMPTKTAAACSEIEAACTRSRSASFAPPVSHRDSIGIHHGREHRLTRRCVPKARRSQRTAPR